MHSISALITSALLFSSALAAPSWKSWEKCLSKDDAAYLVNGFASLISNYQDSVAVALLADGFTDTSDSINELAHIPLGSVTFPSKQAFQAGQGSQPKFPFQVLNIDAVSCDTIAFRWVANPGPTPVKGINILGATKSSGKWQIQTVYSEFNSIAFLQDIGGSVTFPPPPPSH